MIDGDDEDNFEMEAHLEEQAKNPPLSSKPEQQSNPPAQGGQEPAKPTQQQASEPEPVLPDDLKGKFVPHGRFHETNERLKESQQRYSVLERRTDQLLEIINGQLGRQAPAAPAAEEIPDPETDFVGALKWSMGKLKDGQKLTQEQQTRQKQQQDGIALGQRVLADTQRDFAAAQAEDPTLQPAYDHLTNSRVSELMAIRGITKPQAEAVYQQEELEMYHGALQRGERPSAVVKRLAQARGWAPQPANQQQEQPNRDQRREQHLSLTQMGGKTAPGPLTAKDLANMDEDEYAKLTETAIKAARRSERAA